MEKLEFFGYGILKLASLFLIELFIWCYMDSLEWTKASLIIRSLSFETFKTSS